MLRFATRYAHWLDLWLRKHIGRPYETALAVGLVLSIGATIGSLAHVVATGGNDPQGDLLKDFIKTVVVVVFQVALLINQLAQLDEHRARRRRRRMREQDKARVAGAGAER